ncbi:MAG: OmpA family protein [Zavarzinia sp.]|nr:OmpA family protein [Zavarzinia sp.]
MPSQCQVYEAIGRALPPECLGDAGAGVGGGIGVRGLGLDDGALDDEGASGSAGVAVGEPAPGVPVTPRPTRPAPTTPAPTVKEGVFTLQFALNSADLTAQARSVLDKVAVVMNDPASAGAKFVIKGFTDASGSAETNMALSQARAESARRYLIEVRGVPAAMVAAEGHGETGLLPGLSPTSPWHRRVEIVADFRG